MLPGKARPLGRTSSAIGKQPVAGPVRVHRLGLKGDEQADRRVHGGEDKAVHCCAWHHYAAWLQELPASWRRLFERRLVFGQVEDWSSRMNP